jgi:pantetheine-phosphate adenylyltransferase
MPRIAIFPGSFDPFTKGHEDIVRRSLPLFDELIIAIGNNSSKQRYFTIDFLTEKILETFADQPQVKVQEYAGLTATFAKSIDAKFIVRGLRNTTDFEYENTIAQANKQVWQELETVFMITSPHLAYISSSIVRDIHKYGGDVAAFLPYKI